MGKKNPNHINMSLAPEYRERATELGERLHEQGVPGLITNFGTINLSALFRYLIDNYTEKQKNTPA